jgi:hypothetical protein
MRRTPAQEQKAMISYDSIPVVVLVVMVPMMVPVPLLPPIFVRVTVVAVSVVTIVIRSVLWVSGANVNAKPIICFGLGGCQGNQSECCQTQEEKSFHMNLSQVRRKQIVSRAVLRFESGDSLTISRVKLVNQA